MSHKKFSIIIPVFQSGKNLAANIPKLHQLCTQLSDLDIEIVAVDDGSTDDSFAVLRRLQQQEKSLDINIVRLTRNFGQTPAIQAGLRHARGDCVGIISADFQEPHHLFIDMIQHWQKGEKFIIGERVKRAEGPIHSFISSLYWRLVKGFALKDFPKIGYDFCLLDRSVVNTINTISERNTSIFVLIFWLGFPVKRIPIERSLRTIGKSQWSFAKKLRLTIDTVIGFTYIPIRCMTFLGLTTAFCTVIYLLYWLLKWFFFGTTVPGWMTLVTLLLIFGSLTMFCFGIIGEYLWRILDEVRGRPFFIVDEVYHSDSK